MGTIDRALKFVELSMGLKLAVARMVHAGKADRVDSIIPKELFTSLELARAEAEAELRYASDD